MSLEASTDLINPLTHTEAIVDEEGRPTPYFMRQWLSQQGINEGSDAVVAAVIALQALNLIAGVGLDGGGTLTADRTFDLTDGARSYDIGMFFPGLLTNAQTLVAFVFDRTVTFPDEFAGSTGSSITNPTAAATIDVQKNTSSIGTINITTGGVFSFVTAGSGVETFVSGDVLTLIAQATADATLADVSVTFSGLKTLA